MNYNSYSHQRAWLLTHTGTVISSIVTIDTNIKRSYSEIFPDMKVVVLSDDITSGFDKALNDFEKDTPDFVIVTHPLAMGHHFLKYVLASEKADKIQFIFHIYGDFIRRAVLHCLKEPLMVNKKIKCVFPSSGYLKTVSSFFLDQTNIAFVPVPVGSEVFHYNHKERQQTRQELSLKEEEIVFVYSGRISNQKNIAIAAQMLKEVCEDLGRPYQFLLVGAFDDYEGATVGSDHVLGSIYAEVTKEDNTSIRYLGFKHKNELRKIYNAADIYISLSTFHDESFGLSPLEALMSGTSSLLTRWGGYRDYETVSKTYCQTLSLNLTADGFEISAEEFKNKLSILLSAQDKEDCSTIYQQHYDHSAVKVMIEELLSSKISLFKGFTEKLHNIALEQINSKKTMSLESYQQIYKNMWD